MRFVFILALFATLAVPLSAQDFDKWLLAAQRGDSAIALKGWRPLAEARNPVAQKNLGLMYYNGDGVGKDDKEAAYWYRLAAEQGDADAQYGLALIYEKGQGSTQDHKQAITWYKLAAEQGHADAQKIWV